MSTKRKQGLTTYSRRGSNGAKEFRRACPNCDYRSRWYPTLKASHVETHCDTCFEMEGIPLNIDWARRA